MGALDKHEANGFGDYFIHLIGCVVGYFIVHGLEIFTLSQEHVQRFNSMKNGMSYFFFGVKILLIIYAVIVVLKIVNKLVFRK